MVVPLTVAARVAPLGIVKAYELRVLIKPPCRLFRSGKEPAGKILIIFPVHHTAKGAHCRRISHSHGGHREKIELLPVILRHYKGCMEGGCHLVVHAPVLSLHFKDPFQLVPYLRKYIRGIPLGDIQPLPLKRLGEKPVCVQQMCAGTGSRCHIAAVVTCIVPAPGHIHLRFPVLPQPCRGGVAFPVVPYSPVPLLNAAAAAKVVVCL